MQAGKINYLDPNGVEHQILPELYSPLKEDRTGSKDLRENLRKQRWDLAAQSLRNAFNSPSDMILTDNQDLAVLHALHVTKLKAVHEKNPPKFLAEKVNTEVNAYDIQVREVLGEKAENKKGTLDLYLGYLENPTSLEAAKVKLLKKYQVD